MPFDLGVPVLVFQKETKAYMKLTPTLHEAYKVTVWQIASGVLMTSNGERGRPHVSQFGRCIAPFQDVELK